MKKNFRLFSLVLLMLTLLITPQVSGAELAEGPIQEDTTLENYTVEAVGEEYTIVTIVKGEMGWFSRMEDGVNQFAESTGHNAYQLTPASFDAPVQVGMIEDLIAKGNVDAIAIVPNSVPAVDPALKKAQENGIVTIGHEASNLDNADFDIEGFDNAAYGRHWMDWLAEKMDEEGKYAAFVGHLTARSHNEFIDAAIARQKEKYPDMEMIGERHESEESTQLAYQKTKNLLKNYPELEGILSCASSAAPGIAKAIAEFGLEDEIYTAGTSLVSQTGKYLSSGAFDMISFWDPAYAGYAMNKVAVNVLQGREIQEGFDLGIEGYHSLIRNGTVLRGEAWVDVTAENMDKYDF